MKVVCFGEIMLRLNPEGYLRFPQANKFEASYGGGEANVTVSLANYGDAAAFVSAVPAHEIGQNAVNALRMYGVDTSLMLRQGPRLGIYFCEKGASQRGSKVVYDRAGSSIALSKRSDYDWNKIFEGATWFHFTGITPALGGELPDICLNAVKAAKEKGLTVSCDLNYRGKLWTREAAGAVMGRLMPYVDVCIANEEDAKDVFGIAAENTDINSGKLDKAGYVSVAKQLVDRFGFKYVAITLRGSISASDNNWSGMLYDGKDAFFAKNYLIHMVDRVGGGDSFGGGLIHAMNKWPGGPQAIIEFAVAASCLKQTTEFDFNLASEKEVLALAGGNASGRVQR
ncbi:MAG: sugar kinase [Clostridia bacterium]|nr:sugar kinase [Clostridia bacterium]